jgi:predicted NAD-dependent protein-ADP-ribosyltransferase YbiA (DUF1768 family)
MDPSLPPIRFRTRKDLHGHFLTYHKGAPIRHEGKTFASVEHLYQWLRYSTSERKTPLSEEYAEVIRTVPDPKIAHLLGECKHLGAEDVDKYKNRTWFKTYEDAQKRKDELAPRDESWNLHGMRIALCARAECDEEFADALKHTGRRPIELDSTNIFWGINYKKERPRGFNHYGRLLVELRTRLLSEADERLGVQRTLSVTGEEPEFDLQPANVTIEPLPKRRKVSRLYPTTEVEHQGTGASLLDAIVKAYSLRPFEASNVVLLRKSDWSEIPATDAPVPEDASEIVFYVRRNTGDAPWK